MIDDDDIPVLTDLIEETKDEIKSNITQPQLGLSDIDQDLLIDDDDGPIIDLDVLPEKPLIDQLVPDSAATNPRLEQTIKRILDEHMELAWQEIRIAIQLELDDMDSNR